MSTSQNVKSGTEFSAFWTPNFHLLSGVFPKLQKRTTSNPLKFQWKMAWIRLAIIFFMSRILTELFYPVFINRACVHSPILFVLFRRFYILAIGCSVQFWVLAAIGSSFWLCLLKKVHCIIKFLVLPHAWNGLGNNRFNQFVDRENQNQNQCKEWFEEKSANSWKMHASRQNFLIKIELERTQWTTLSLFFGDVPELSIVTKEI